MGSSRPGIQIAYVYVYIRRRVHVQCAAIIKLRRRRSDEVRTTSRIATVGDFKAVVKPFLAFLLYDFTCTAVGLLCFGDEYELIGEIIGRRLRPVSVHIGR